MTVEPVSLEAVTLRLRQLLAAQLDLHVSAIHETDRILDGPDDDGLALDSLDVLKLALYLAEEYGLREPAEIDWRTVRTVQDAAELVYRLVTA